MRAMRIREHAWDDLVLPVRVGAGGEGGLDGGPAAARAGMEEAVPPDAPLAALEGSA